MMDNQSKKAKKKQSSDAEFLKEARERYDESLQASDDNRTTSIHDSAFENDQQWTDAEKEERRGRSCVTINKVAGVNKQIVGEARQNRPGIKVRPVDSSSDPMTAQIFTGLIRNIENVSDAEAAYDNGLECAVRGGYGYWRVLTRLNESDPFVQDIVIDRIVNPNSVAYDESAIRTDYSDAMYCFISETMTMDKFKKTWPKAEPSDWPEASGESESDWFSSETVRVAEYFYKEPCKKHFFMLMSGETIEVSDPKVEDMEIDGHWIQTVADGDGQPMPYRKTITIESHKVMWCKMSGHEILEGPTRWAGKYIPVIVCLGEEVWIEGKRVLRSAIRHAIDAQKLYNWARSNNMETLALAPKQPWLITLEQLGNYKEMWDKAYHTAMPYLLYNHVDGHAQPRRLSGSIGDSGANQEAMLASDDIKTTTGIFDASLGNRGNETSGKAINARQRQGSTATFVYTDNQTRAVKYTGKVLVDLIPKIIDTERVVRLMGDDLQKRFPAPQPGQPDTGVQVHEDGLGAWARVNFADPMTGKILNDLSVGKYDVYTDAGPGYATQRQEAADSMAQIIQSIPQAAPALVPRIAKSLDWPDSQEIGDELQALFQPPQPQGPSPQDQLDMQKGQLDIQGKELDIAKKAQDIKADQADQQQMMQQIAMDVVINVLSQLGGAR